MEVNPMSKKEIKWSDYKKVPILKVDDEQMVDSSGSWEFLYETVFSNSLSLNFNFSALYLVKFQCFVCTDIIDKLFKRINPENTVVDSEEEKKWRE